MMASVVNDRARAPCVFNEEAFIVEDILFFFFFSFSHEKRLTTFTSVSKWLMYVELIVRRNFVNQTSGHTIMIGIEY